MPAGRVAIARPVAPLAVDGDAHVRVGQYAHVAVGCHPGTGAVCLVPSVPVAQGVKHQCRAVSELQSKPVPADFGGPESTAPPLAVEPTEAVDLDGPAVAQQPAPHAEAGDR